MEQTKFYIKCRSCDKDVYFSSYHADSKECKKARCWLKTLKARTEAAVLKGCNADDFIAPTAGKVIMHKEPEKTCGNQASGKWVQGRWYPYANGYTPDEDCY